MGQLQERYKNYREPQKYMAAGVYPYFREITSKVLFGFYRVCLFDALAMTCCYVHYLLRSVTYC